LVLAAHGSADPRFADVVGAVTALVRRRRPELDVRVDIPAQVPDAVASDPVGPDARLAVVAERRLREAGWDGRAPVLLCAAGSSDDRALDDVRTVAHLLATTQHVDVTAAFLSAGLPRVDEALRARPDAALASYLVAPGTFHDLLVRSGATVVSDPLGADPLVAEIVLDRYDAAVQVPGRTAPA
jgi:sirohydrochlorin ferrochelatase